MPPDDAYSGPTTAPPDGLLRGLLTVQILHDDDDDDEDIDGPIATDGLIEAGGGRRGKA